jgi:hypothetical protein
LDAPGLTLLGIGVSFLDLNLLHVFWLGGVYRICKKMTTIKKCNAWGANVQHDAWTGAN